MLTRKAGESIDIDNGRIRIVVVRIKGRFVGLGLEADDVRILRSELVEAASTDGEATPLRC